MGSCCQGRPFARHRYLPARSTATFLRFRARMGSCHIAACRRQLVPYIRSTITVIRLCRRAVAFVRCGIRVTRLPVATVESWGASLGEPLQSSPQVFVFLV